MKKQYQIGREKAVQALREQAPLTNENVQTVFPLSGVVVSTKVMHGLSMRSYREVIQQFVKAYGVDKSTISEYFIPVSGERLIPCFPSQSGPLDSPKLPGPHPPQ